MDAGRGRAREAVGRRLPAVTAWCASPTAWSVACGLIAALPIAGVVVGLGRLGWAPQGDNAALSWRAWLVFEGRPPLVGPYTLASGTGEWAYNPGPLLFWVMAVPARIWPGIGPVVGVAALGAASVVAGVVAAGQVGGRAVTAVLAVGGLLGARSAAAVLADPVWNPYATLLPFVGLLLVSWAVAAGRLGWWPLAVFLGSFCAQAHLTFALPALLVTLGAPVAGLVARRRPEPGSDGPAAGSASRPYPGPGWRWLAGGAAVAAAVWAAPLWQQATGDPGNLSTLWRTSRHGQGELVGPTTALRVVGWSVVGRPPLWLRPPQLDVLTAVGSWGQVPPAATVLAWVALAAALVAGFRRRLHDVVGLALVALASSVGFALALQSASAEHLFLGSFYLLTALYAIGMVVWLALGWAAWRLLVQPRLAGRSPRSVLRLPALATRPGLPAALLAGLAVCAVAVTVWLGDWGPHMRDGQPMGWRNLADINDQVLAVVERSDVPRGRLVLDTSGLGGELQFKVTRGLGYGLLVRGWTPTVGDFDLKMIDDRHFSARPGDPRLAFGPAGAPPPDGARRLGTIHDPTSGRDFAVYLVRPRTPDARGLHPPGRPRPPSPGGRRPLGLRRGPSG